MTEGKKQKIWKKNTKKCLKKTNKEKYMKYIKNHS